MFSAWRSVLLVMAGLDMAIPAGGILLRELLREERRVKLQTC
jgi:hypothetical protein